MKRYLLAFAMLVVACDESGSMPASESSEQSCSDVRAAILDECSDLYETERACWAAHDALRDECGVLDGAAAECRAAVDDCDALYEQCQEGPDACDSQYSECISTAAEERMRCAELEQEMRPLVRQCREEAEIAMEDCGRKSGENNWCEMALGGDDVTNTTGEFTASDVVAYCDHDVTGDGRWCPEAEVGCEL